MVGGQSLEMLLSLVRQMRNPRMPRGRAHYRSDTPPFQKVMAMSRAAVAPSMTRRWRKHSPPAKKRACSLRIQYQHSGSVKTGSLAKWRSNRSSSNPLVVEGAEFRRQAAEGPDKPELRGDDVNDETEPHLLRKLETVLGFTLRPRQAGLPPREEFVFRSLQL